MPDQSGTTNTRTPAGSSISRASLPRLAGVLTTGLIVAISGFATTSAAASTPLDRTNTLLDRGQGGGAGGGGQAGGGGRSPGALGAAGVRVRAPAPIRTTVPNARRDAVGGARGGVVESGVFDVGTRAGRVRVVSPEVAERAGIIQHDDHGVHAGFNSTTGFNARGSFGGDDFRLYFTVGNEPVFVPSVGFVGYRGTISPADSRFWGGASRSYIGVGGSSFSHRTFTSNPCWDGRCNTVIVQSPAYVDPTWIVSATPPSSLAAAAQAQPQPEPTTFDLARDAIHAAAWQAADTLLLSHLEQYPDDADALRLLAITRLETGRPDDAIALMASAYEREPWLAATPLYADEFHGGTRAMRQRVRNAVTIAHRRDTASAWLLVTVLMQAEGSDRYAVAGNMLVRAAQRGLDPTVTRLFAEALGLRPERITPILNARSDKTPNSPLIPKQTANPETHAAATPNKD